MYNKKSQKQVISVLIGSALLAVGQYAIAHTTIADSELKEGARVYTAATVPHGCDGSAVRAQSMLFPVGNNPVAIDNNGTSIDLADHLTGVSSGGGIPLGPRFIQDKNAFRSITNIVDSDNNRVGATFDFGYLQPDLTAWIPFRMSAPTFASSSCADSLTIRVPIVNACNKSATAENRVDAWVGRLTAKYNDPAVVSENFWPSITVTRDLETNPIPASCSATIQLDVSPNDQQIDNHLGIPGYWPNN